MDQSLFLFLNALPAHLAGVGKIAVILAKDAIVLYGVVLVALWWRAGRGAAGQSGTSGRFAAHAGSDARRQVLLLALLAAVMALGINAILNWAVPRPRPFATLPAHLLVPSPHDPSFPSDHAAVASAVGMVLLMGGEPVWGVLGMVGAALIGAARVVTGVHYPSDIVGGIFVGTICGIAAVRARDLLNPVLNFVLKTTRSLRLV